MYANVFLHVERDRMPAERQGTLRRLGSHVQIRCYHPPRSKASTMAHRPSRRSACPQSGKAAGSKARCQAPGPVACQACSWARSIPFFVPLFYEGNPLIIKADAAGPRLRNRTGCNPCATADPKMVQKLSVKPSAQSTTTKRPSTSGKQSVICWVSPKCGATRCSKQGRSSGGSCRRGSEIHWL